MHDEMMIFGFVDSGVRSCRDANWRWSGEKKRLGKSRGWDLRERVGLLYA